MIFRVTPDALFLLKNRYERVDRRLAVSSDAGPTHLGIQLMQLQFAVSADRFKGGCIVYKMNVMVT
jgi:hypothetical protein